MSKGTTEEFSAFLSRLKMNSKTHIKMLTLMAEYHIERAQEIVSIVEEYFEEVTVYTKLTVFYLIDSILRNVGQQYVGLFVKNIVSNFCSVFKEAPISVRVKLFELRQTWSEVFPAKVMYLLDREINSIYQTWPITAPAESHKREEDCTSTKSPHTVCDDVVFRTFPNLKSEPEMENERKYDLKTHFDLIKPLSPTTIPKGLLEIRDIIKRSSPDDEDIGHLAKRQRTSTEEEMKVKVTLKKEAIGSSPCSDPNNRDLRHISQISDFSSISLQTKQVITLSFGREEEPHVEVQASLPKADPAVLDLIDRDPMICVPVGGSTKEVRFYGENAIIMLDSNDPRDLLFKPGSRRVIIDQTDSFMLQLNSRYSEVTLSSGLKYNLRLGSPSRELYINGCFHKITFGGPPVEVFIAGRRHVVQLEGPPPHLHIGLNRRTDLVAGRVNLMVNGNTDDTAYIYLDAKPQRIDIDGVPFILRFVESLQVLLINSIPHRIVFGGPALPIHFLHKRYFLQLTKLPEGIVPGLVSIINMEGGRLPPVIPSFPQNISEVRTPTIAVASTSIANTPLPSATELYSKLLAIGLLSHNNKKKEPDNKNAVKPVDPDDPATFKVKQPGLVELLYFGISCSSCALRFPKDQTAKYREHLDWHFHLNRQISKGGLTRKYNYKLSDWLQYQEFDDKDDTPKSWCELRKDNKSVKKAEAPPPKVPSKGFGMNPCCIVCRDRFEEIFNHEEEEWQLVHAACVADRLYHPLCLKDEKGKTGRTFILDRKAFPEEDNRTL